MCGKYEVFLGSRYRRGHLILNTSGCVCVCTPSCRKPVIPKDAVTYWGTLDKFKIRRIKLCHYLVRKKHL